ncbi:16S rRNA (adenine(1518)-N(6)/adenine(1519)-N(6))-dimethyltransferase RsmA [Dellaglioa sp. P0083]|uniref:16S rRNA (adenine(1518)-N(6)/adenine(1519)-N(6))- dimethyltransferase RsmA n=1 Tax=Dellaglioa kimchii TaxID=3344667 RepID=UPI0038D474AF
MANNDVPDIASPIRTKAIMETYGLTFKKSLGQNFLTDKNVLMNIVDAGDITAEDDVIEIGPGIGSLTEQLARRAHHVLAIEIDQNLIPVLGETLSPYDNVDIVEQDILKANLPALVEEHFDGQHPLKLVANLPYYITTPIIMHLLETAVKLDKIVVMMQKEVAERIAADPGSRTYGSLTVAVQYEMDAEVAFVVPRTVFIPQPNVDSAIIVLNQKEGDVERPISEKVFFKLVKGSFQHRRKSLWNNLQSIYGKTPEIREALQAALDASEISAQIRAEKLSIHEFIVLSNNLIKVEEKFN